jgi:hypothetical protein
MNTEPTHQGGQAHDRPWLYVSGAGLPWTDWARYRPVARVRLGFHHVLDPAGGVVIAWARSWARMESCHAERIPRVLAPGSVTIRATSVTNNCP